MDGRRKENLSGVRKRPKSGEVGFKPYRISVEKKTEFRRRVSGSRQFVPQERADVT